MRITNLTKSSVKELTTSISPHTDIKTRKQTKISTAYLQTGSTSRLTGNRKHTTAGLTKQIIHLQTSQKPTLPKTNYQSTTPHGIGKQHLAEKSSSGKVAVIAGSIVGAIVVLVCVVLIVVTLIRKGKCSWDPDVVLDHDSEPNNVNMKPLNGGRYFLDNQHQYQHSNLKTDTSYGGTTNYYDKNQC
jgi:hypothetical protein